MPTSNGWHRKRNTAAVKARAARYNTPEHREAKEQFRAQVAAGHARCWRCGAPIPPGSRCGPDWQTGHDATGTRIMGPEHTHCNRRDGAVRGARKRNGPGTTPLTW